MRSPRSEIAPVPAPGIQEVAASRVSRTQAATGAAAAAISATDSAGKYQPGLTAPMSQGDLASASTSGTS